MMQNSQQGTQPKKFSKVTPLWKFILLSVITLGIYELVWFYRNWKFLKKQRELKISPFWRTFFAPLFTISIAQHLQKYLREKNSPCDYSPVLVGVSYFGILFFSRILQGPSYWLISFFTFIPMLPLVSSMNAYWQKEEKDLPLKKFTWWQIILVILGIILSVLLVIGAFMREYSYDGSGAEIEDHRKAFVTGCVDGGGTEKECDCIFIETIKKYGFEKYRENNYVIVTEGQDAVDSDYLDFLLNESPALCQ